MTPNHLAVLTILTTVLFAYLWQREFMRRVAAERSLTELEHQAGVEVRR